MNPVTHDEYAVNVLPWAGFSSAVSLTFDDAQPSHAAHLDALTATGVPMTFFVNSSVAFPGSDAVWRKAVAAGHELGNHTASHPHYPLGEPMGDGAFGDAAPTPKEELEACEAFIRERSGQKGVWTFASPYGDEGWEPVAAARYPLIRSVAEGTVPPGNGRPDGVRASHLPCAMAREGDTAAGTFIPQLEKAREAGHWLVFCFHSILPTEENWYAGVGIDEIVGIAQHARATGTVWADTFARVGAYWLARRAFLDLKPEWDGTNRIWEWTVPDGFPPNVWLRVTAPKGRLYQEGRLLPDAETGMYEISFDGGRLRYEPR